MLIRFFLVFGLHFVQLRLRRYHLFSKKVIFYVR